MSVGTRHNYLDHRKTMDWSDVKVVKHWLICISGVCVYGAA